MHLEFGRSEASCLLTSTSTPCCQTCSLHWLSLPLPKASFKQEKNRNSDHQSTLDESQPSKSSLRANRRKRQNDTYTKSLQAELQTLLTQHGQPDRDGKGGSTVAKAKALQRRLLFLQPFIWAGRATDDAGQRLCFG